MSRRKIEDEAEARRCLLAIETEGWDIRTWARAHDVDGRSLHAWSINLARVGTRMPKRAARRDHVALAPRVNGLVELVPNRAARRLSSADIGRYVLEVGGTRVEFGDDFSEPTLRRIVGVLRSC